MAWQRGASFSDGSAVTLGSERKKRMAMELRTGLLTTTGLALGTGAWIVEQQESFLS